MAGKNRRRMLPALNRYRRDDLFFVVSGMGDRRQVMWAFREFGRGRLTPADRPLEQYMDEGFYDQAVYVLRAGPFTKVGISNDPAWRIKTLQTGCPYAITKAALFLPRRPELGPMVKSVEKWAHDYLRPFRTETESEWFYVSPTTAARAVREAIEGQGIGEWLVEGECP